MSKGKEYTQADVRKHCSMNDAWMSVHGKVYDVTKYIKKHPGGEVIHCGFGRDATTLFETHHSVIDIDKSYAVLAKYEIGYIKDYEPKAVFDSPFAKALVSRVKEKIKGKSYRGSWYALSACLFFYTLFIIGIALAFYSGSYWICPFIAFSMSIGHLAGHQGNHWGITETEWFNKLISKTCTSLWGLREKNWEFSHLISHHCYNYTDRDYVMEQHVPMAYFRVRNEDPWKPIHAYQHWIYLTTPFTAFLVGGLRLDCAPFIFVSPFLESIRMNRDSPIPAPQFFSAGSNATEEELPVNHDGVGPEKFVIFDLDLDSIISLLISNMVWLPLFIYNVVHRGWYHAIVFPFCCFGWQAALVTKSLLQQHMCENIKLCANYENGDCWYKKQIEGSTTIHKNDFVTWLAHAINFQTEHHLFPCMNPELLLIVQPVVEETCKEFGIQYNSIQGEFAASQQVFNQFKIMSVKPENLKSD